LALKEDPVPRYDYKCPNCANRFELKQSFSDKPVADCPECGTASQRQFHAVPVVFKGSGFYVNEYGKGSGNNGKPTAEKDKDKDSAKSESTSESKSETKSESTSASDTKSETEKKPAATT